jgi:hypothetical protein
MDLFNNPDIEPDLKIFILCIIFAFFIPQILNGIPEIYRDNKRYKASYFLRLLYSNYER